LSLGKLDRGKGGGRGSREDKPAFEWKQASSRLLFVACGDKLRILTRSGEGGEGGRGRRRRGRLFSFLGD